MSLGIIERAVRLVHAQMGKKTRPLDERRGKIARKNYLCGKTESKFVQPT